MDAQGYYYPMSSQAPNYVRPEKAEDWEPYQAEIARLYKTKKLKDVMEEMETRWGFKATTRQYKGKIKQWGLDTKYTKTEEYLEVLKEKKKLEKEGSSSKKEVTIRGKPVSDSKLARFERRAKKRGILPNEDPNADPNVDYQSTDYQDAGYEDADYQSYAGYQYQYQDVDYQNAGPSNAGESSETWSGY